MLQMQVNRKRKRIKIRMINRRHTQLQSEPNTQASTSATRNYASKHATQHCSQPAQTAAPSQAAATGQSKCSRRQRPALKATGQRTAVIKGPIQGQRPSGQQGQQSKADNVQSRSTSKWSTAKAKVLAVKADSVQVVKVPRRTRSASKRSIRWSRQANVQARTGGHGSRRTNDQCQQQSARASASSAVPAVKAPSQTAAGPKSVAVR